MVVFLMAVAVLYMVPWLIAIDRNHKDRVAIAVVNFFLGWTLIGWVISLAWAVKADCQRPRAYQIKKVLTCLLVLGSLNLFPLTLPSIAGGRTFTAVLTYNTHHNQGDWDTLFGDYILTFTVNKSSKEVIATFPLNVFSQNSPPWHDNERLPAWLPQVAVLIPPANAIYGDCHHPLVTHRDGPCIGKLAPTIKGDLVEIRIPRKWFYEVANHYYVRKLRWDTCIETDGATDIAFPPNRCPPPSTGGGLVMYQDQVDPPMIAVKFVITWDYFSGGNAEFIMMGDGPWVRYLACEVVAKNGYPELCPGEEHYGELDRLRAWAGEVKGHKPIKEEPDCTCPNS